MKSRSKGAEERPDDRARLEAWEEKVQAGYDRLEEKDGCGACEHWLEAWSLFLEIVQGSDIPSTREFDERFGTDYLAFNWVPDLEVALWNAGLKDSRFFRAGIRYANEYLQKFAEDDSLTSENMRRALASFHCRLGDMEKVDSLYGEWLSRDPAWGWGWIGWSDCYRFDAPERQLDRSETLLQKGLAVPK